MTGWGSKVFPPGGGAGGQVIPVGPTQTPGDTATPDPGYSIYNEISGVPQMTITNILTFVVPTSTVHHLMTVEYGGCNIGEYYLEIDGSREHRASTYFGSPFTGMWDFRNPRGGGYLLPAGKIVRVQCQHWRPHDGEFYCRLSYMEIN